MIRINKDFCLLTLRSMAEINPTLSLVIKDEAAGEYINGDEVGLTSKIIYRDDWTVQVNTDSNTCSMITDELGWISTSDQPIEVVGYFVFNESSVLFYDIFKNSVILERGNPFNLSPCLTMKYDSVDDDFPSIGR